MLERVDTRHRWLDILPALGVPSRFLRNKHGPCPMCGRQWLASPLIPPTSRVDQKRQLVAFASEFWDSFIC
jgi:hypothetical protein